jgi:hypothetical protein
MKKEEWMKKNIVADQKKRGYRWKRLKRKNKMKERKNENKGEYV